MVADARALNVWRRWGYRLLPGDLFSYLLHMRPAEWPIMAGHTLLGYVLAVGIDGGVHGRFLPEAVLVGPEARGSAPVRVVRDPQTRESPGVTGLYPVGEGAGYAGGIVSAAVDGLRTAKAIIGKYARVG